MVCVDNVVDFTSAFLFSVETQHTIGYEEEIKTFKKVTFVILATEAVPPPPSVPLP